MKKGLITFLVLIFFSGYFFSSIQYSFAQTITPSSTASAKIEYELAYPGMLPDNPLYFTKMLRDKIISVLINDPFKKAEFNLLNSDKRLVAAHMLLDAKKPDLAITTLSKSNNYMFEAIQEVKKATAMGKDTILLLERMKSSVKKHLEIVTGLESRAQKPINMLLKAEKNRLSQFDTEIQSLSSKK